MIAIYLGARQAARIGEDPEPVRDLCFWLLVSSMIGSRLLFVATNLPSFARSCSQAASEGPLAHALWGCTRALHLWEGGLVFFGGLFAATATAWWFTHRRRMSFARTADVLAPSIAIGHFFGRLGCFAAGCCWGKPASGPLAMRFPHDSLVFQQYVLDGLIARSSDVTPALHPVQLYEAAGELALFAGLTWFARRKRYDGQVLVAYLFGYSVLRFVVEIFRGDAGRKFLVPGVSTSQAIALATVPLAIALAVVFKKRQHDFAHA